MQKSVSGASSLCQDAKAFKVRKELGSTHSSYCLLEDRSRHVDFHWATANGRVMIQKVVLMVFESLGLHGRVMNNRCEWASTPSRSRPSSELPGTKRTEMKSVQRSSVLQYLVEQHQDHCHSKTLKCRANSWTFDFQGARKRRIEYPYFSASAPTSQVIVTTVPSADSTPARRRGHCHLMKWRRRNNDKRSLIGFTQTRTWASCFKTVFASLLRGTKTTLNYQDANAENTKIENSDEHCSLCSNQKQNSNIKL